MDNEELREMYANLLANSMNKVVKNGVHPSYVEIIKQLSPDEAKIINYLNKCKVYPCIGIKLVNDDGSFIEVSKFFSDLPELAKCENIIDYNKYLDNLERLGLIEKHNDKYLNENSFYEKIKENQYFKKINEIAQNKMKIVMKYKKMEYIKEYIELTIYGKEFCNICLKVNQ